MVAVSGPPSLDRSEHHRAEKQAYKQASPDADRLPDDHGVLPDRDIWRAHPPSPPRHPTVAKREGEGASRFVARGDAFLPNRAMGASLHQQVAPITVVSSETTGKADRCRGKLKGAGMVLCVPELIGCEGHVDPTTTLRSVTQMAT